MKKKISLLLLISLLLCACGAETTPTTEAEAVLPPREILYLGGAHILEQFTVTGGPGSTDGQDTIVIMITPNLVMDGFHLAIAGFYEDGSQDVLVTERDIEPAQYYTIEKDTYSAYSELILYLDYTWNGDLMSQRIVNLLTLEDWSSVRQELGLTA